MRYLVATDSVHTTAAACDYLEARLDGDDAVSVVTVPETGGSDTAGPGSSARDVDDALNVASARLLCAAKVETERLAADADPASAILDAATERNADAIVVGTHAGLPGTEPTLGGTARRIVEGADVPVVVVPLSL